VLVDGVPRNRALGGAVDLSSIPASQIESITVYRGFAPASLGPAGIGGVVDVRTRAGQGANDPAFDLVAGELDTVRVSGGFGLRTGASHRLTAGLEALRSHGDFRYLDTGTLPDFDSRDDVVLRRSNNDLEQGSAELRFARDGARGETLSTALRVERRGRGIPGPDGLPSETAELDESRIELLAGWQAPLAARRAELRLDGQLFREDVRFRDLLGLRSTDTRTASDGGGLAASLRFDLDLHQWLVRADVRVEEASTDDRALDASDRGGVRRVTTALTAEDVVAFGRVALAPSLRWERRDDDFVPGSAGVVPPPAPDVREDDVSGKLGLAVRLDRGWTLRGSAGSFHRAPSLVELFGDRGALRGNPDLVSERGHALELGVAHRARGHVPAFEAVAFARRTDDLILLEPRSQGVLVPDNLARAEVLGIELDVSTATWRGLALDASLTLQDPRDTSDGGERPLPFEPDVLGWLGARFSRGRLGASWEITHVGSNAFQDERVTARTIHDAGVSWDAGSGFEIGVDVRNAFDRMTRDVARHPLPDRVVSFHLGWRGGGS
jgi:iron complex outermembrane receptor protein